jgi:hypothetical protein
MNERIRELAKQAGGHFSTHNLMSNPVQYRESVELWDDKIEKFAELIVRECIMVCWPGGESDVLYEQASAIDKAFIDGQDACVERLKQHFGVES